MSAMGVCVSVCGGGGDDVLGVFLTIISCEHLYVYA